MMIQIPIKEQDISIKIQFQPNGTELLFQIFGINMGSMGSLVREILTPSQSNEILRILEQVAPSFGFPKPEGPSVADAVEAYETLAAQAREALAKLVQTEHELEETRRSLTTRNDELAHSEKLLENATEELVKLRELVSNYREAPTEP